jgi:hypothetical protein
MRPLVLEVTDHNYCMRAQTQWEICPTVSSATQRRRRYRAKPRVSERSERHPGIVNTNHSTLKALPRTTAALIRQGKAVGVETSRFRDPGYDAGAS